MNSYRHLQGHTYVTPFTAHTRISDVILGSASALLIISRFGIPLGFGDQSIGQVCQEHGVDVKTLLLLLNSSIIDGYEPTPELIASVHLDSLLKYLINSHSYFLDFRLPLIRQRLLSAMSNCPQDLMYVIRRFFDEYAEEVRKHMNYEDPSRLPLCPQAHGGRARQQLQHRYLHQASRPDRAQDHRAQEPPDQVLHRSDGLRDDRRAHDIFAVEVDLAGHNYIEDAIFTPFIEYLESQQA